MQLKAGKMTERMMTILKMILKMIRSGMAIAVHQINEAHGCMTGHATK